MSQQQSETVEVDAENAEVALRELNILIRETDPVEEEASDFEEPGQSMSPLGRAKSRIQARIDEADEADEEEVKAGLIIARCIINRVGRETGAETSNVDPLQSDIFRARYDLVKALGYTDEDLEEMP